MNPSQPRHLRAPRRSISLHLAMLCVLASAASSAHADKERFIAQPRIGTIAIDGAIDDWWSSNPQAVWMGTAQHVKKSNWQGVKDLSAAVFFLYDDQAVYFAAVVFDDIHDQPQTHSRYWNGDAIQLAFDVTGNAAVPVYGESNLELGFALTRNGPRHECTFRNATLTDQAIAAIPYAIRRDSARGQTVYEIALPYDIFQPYVANSRRTMDVCIVVHDNDGGQLAWMETSTGITLGRDPMTFTPLDFAEAAKRDPAVSIFSRMNNLIRTDADTHPLELLLYNSGPAIEPTVQIDLTWNQHTATSRTSVPLPTGITHTKIPLVAQTLHEGLMQGRIAVLTPADTPAAHTTIEASTYKDGPQRCLADLDALIARAKALRTRADQATEKGWHCPKAQTAPAVLEFFEPYVRSSAERSGARFQRALTHLRQLDQILTDAEQEVTQTLDDQRRPPHWPKYRPMPDALKARMANNVLMADDRPLFLIGVHTLGAGIRDAGPLSAMGLNSLAVMVSPGDEHGGPGAETPGAATRPHLHSMDNIDKPITEPTRHFLKEMDLAATKHHMAVDMRFVYYPRAPYRHHRDDPQWHAKRVCGTEYNVGLCCQDPYTIDYCDRAMRKFFELILNETGADAIVSWCMNNEVAMKERCARTVEKFRSHLRHTYITIDALNDAWQSDFKQFADIGIPQTKNNRPHWLEWWMFHDQTCTDFLLWMMENARLNDPSGRRMFKTKQNQEGCRLNVGYQQGIDQERLALADDIVGGDSDSTDIEMKLDLYRALGRGKPFFNDEYHLWFTEAPDAGHAYMYHWQAAIHGQQAALAWVWSDSEHNACLNYNMRYRPNVCYQIARVSRDLNRFAEHAVALAAAQGHVAIVYSRASRIQNDDPYCVDILAQHAALSRLGLVVEFLTERQLTEGVPDRFKAIVLPAATCLPTEGFDALAKFVKRNGTLILAPAALTKDHWYRDNTAKVNALPARNVLRYKAVGNPQTYAAELTSFLKQARVHVPIVRAPNAPDPAIEFRSAICDNQPIVYLCNKSDAPCRIQIHNKTFRAVDLLTATEHTSEITLPARQPLLLTVLTGTSDTLTLTIKE